MANPQTAKEREARKKFIHARHRVVFTGACAFIAAAVLISLPFVLSSSNSKVTDASSSDNFGVTAPCAPEDTVAADTKTITVRVLNGTLKVGLGGAVQEALDLRGFITKDAENYSDTAVSRTEIIFGKNSIVDAYTLLGHFNDAALHMDDRDDKLVDVVIGDTFDNLNPEKDVLTSVGQPLKSVKGCAPSDSMTNLPIAPPHEAV